MITADLISSALHVDPSPVFGKGGGTKAAICSRAKSANIVMTVIRGGYTLQSARNFSSEIQSLRQRCWDRIEKAISLGPTMLLDRHVSHFSRHMTEMEIDIGNSSDNLWLDSSVPAKGQSSADICHSPVLSSQLACFKSSQNIFDSRSASLFNSAFWLGKYLLYSSSSKGVSNLQGLWADGPVSAWNGDYHLNINLQMTYWPAHATGLADSVMPPLIDFIKQVAKSGERTALELYKCPGWVAHGYTDNLLDVGVRGDLMWNLCVTCGSWLSLHLWEHLLHRFDLTFLVDTLLPLYRSSAIFYLSYLHRGPDGYLHSGPTTSPENSFGLNNQKYSSLTFSPAIDLSIIRQVRYI